MCGGCGTPGARRSSHESQRADDLCFERSQSGGVQEPEGAGKHDPPRTGVVPPPDDRSVLAGEAAEFGIADRPGVHPAGCGAQLVGGDVLWVASGVHGAATSEMRLLLVVVCLPPEGFGTHACRAVSPSIRAASMLVLVQLSAGRTSRSLR